MYMVLSFNSLHHAPLKKVAEIQSNIFDRCFSSLKVDPMQESLIKERYCSSEKHFQELLFSHEFAYNFGVFFADNFIKVTVNMGGSHVRMCVFFRDCRSPILGRDACKRCFQIY